MAKAKLSPRQREKVADKLMTWGNIVFSGMVIAPLVSTQFHSADLFVAAGGALLFGVAYVIAILTMKGGGTA